MSFSKKIKIFLLYVNDLILYSDGGIDFLVGEGLKFKVRAQANHLFGSCYLFSYGISWTRPHHSYLLLFKVDNLSLL